MAREIADISAGTGRATFTLNPANLGKLQVDIIQGEEGANVRLTAETDAAATALQQGRHQLQQDSRLQAVRINDVQVERSNDRSEEHTSELQSLMRISYAVFCLKKKKQVIHKR